MTLLAMLVSVLPGIACGFAACALRPRSRYAPLLILFPLGYYMGFLLLSIGIDTAKALNINVSGLVIAAIFAAVLVAALAKLAVCWQRRGVQSSAKHPAGQFSLDLYWPISLRPAQSAWLLLVLAFVTMTSFQLAMAPVSGWDIMGSWSYHARQLIDQGLNGGVIGNYGDLQSHPTASTTLLGWAGWVSSSAGGHALWPWLWAAVCIWLAIYGYGLFREQQLGAGLVATAIVVTPLLENHVALPGYSEIWLTLTSVVASALLAMAIRSRKFGITILALMSALLCIWTRKTGIANTVVLVCAYCLAMLYASDWLSHKKVLLVAIVATSTVGFFLVKGFDFSMAGIYTQWNPDMLMLEFAGRRLELEWQGANQVFINEVHSKLTNMSFSTALVAAFAASFVIVSGVLVCKHGGAAGLFLICAFLGNMLVLVLAQLFSADGMNIALPRMDTGNSRYFLPAVGITGLLVVEAIALISRDASLASEADIG